MITDFNEVLKEWQEKERSKYIYDPNELYYFVSVIYMKNGRKDPNKPNELHPWLNPNEHYHLMDGKRNDSYICKLWTKDELMSQISMINRDGDVVSGDILIWLEQDRNPMSNFSVTLRDGHMEYKDGYKAWKESFNQTGEQWLNSSKLGEIIEY